MQVCLGSASFPHWRCLRAPLLLLPQPPAQWVIPHALLRSRRPSGAPQALRTPAFVMPFIQSKSSSKGREVSYGGCQGFLPVCSHFEPCGWGVLQPPFRSPSYLPNSKLLAPKPSITSAVLQLKCQGWWHMESHHSALWLWEFEGPKSLGAG